jgi:hypothetical protein
MSVAPKRSAFDTIVQGTMVDLFHSLGIALAPVDRNDLLADRARPQELGAQLQFRGGAFSGVLTVSVPSGLYQQAGKQREQTDGRDWIREVTNQIFGRLKRRLLQFQVELGTGLPANLTAEAFDRERKQPGFVVYAFRTLRGEVVVTLSGQLAHSTLAYANAAQIPSEGDVILF